MNGEMFVVLGRVWVVLDKTLLLLACLQDNTRILLLTNSNIKTKKQKESLKIKKYFFILRGMLKKNKSHPYVSHIFWLSFSTTAEVEFQELRELIDNHTLTLSISY